METAAPEGEAAVPVETQLRYRVADGVFEALLGAILRGELEPGAPVPTQRALSRQFRVSPLVVRHAIHRLEELQLVRVRQGSPTIVLDPQGAADVRLIQLQLEAATPGDALALASIENRALSALPLLVLAARRIQPEELDMLDALLDEAAASRLRGDAREAFESEYWTRVAAATRNPILAHQVRWWFHTLRGLGAQSAVRLSAPLEHYRELNETLRSGRVAAEEWLSLLNKLFDWTEAQPGHALRATRAEHASVQRRDRFDPVPRSKTRRD